MTSRVWKAGDVALVTRKGKTEIALRGEDGWSFGDFHRWLGDSFEHDARPLVILDPEQMDIRQLRYSLERWLAWTSLTVEKRAIRKFVAQLEEQLPPDEPTDPVARVTDRRENIWRLLADGDWVCTSGPDIGEYLAWERLAAERGPLTVEVMVP